MKLIKTVDAAGHVLCHDITRIIPGSEKGPVFKKGHIVTEEDIPVLLSVGKENLYVWEKTEGMLHENEAAQILRDICIGDGRYFTAGEPSEGKIEIRAGIDGLFKINREALKAINSLGEMMIASIHSDFPVKKGDKLAGTRIIPLVIEKEKLEAAKSILRCAPLFSILPIFRPKTAIVTTGSEVKKGLIEDAFGPVLRRKMAEYQVPVIGQTIVGDDMSEIVRAIKAYVESGAELVLVSGGMSVDPDDNTPGAIKALGSDIVSYGAPVLPGAMMLVSYYSYEHRTIPVLGLPGCIMYARRTVFDLLLPRILAGERLTAEDISAYGEGGLCKNCELCRFPDCAFGKCN